MKILYNYRAFSKAKSAIYIETGNDYIKDATTGLHGWCRMEKNAIVIGEDDTCFITELREHTVCDTFHPDYGKKVLLPIGFHKSRLLNWLTLPGDQLQLFE